jgi:hypothetical protein
MPAPPGRSGPLTACLTCAGPATRRCRGHMGSGALPTSSSFLSGAHTTGASGRKKHLLLLLHRWNRSAASEALSLGPCAAAPLPSTTSHGGRCSRKLGIFLLRSSVVAVARFPVLPHLLLPSFHGTYAGRSSQKNRGPPWHIGMASMRNRSRVDLTTGGFLRAVWVWPAREAGREYETICFTNFRCLLLSFASPGPGVDRRERIGDRESEAGRAKQRACLVARSNPENSISANF